MSRNTSADPALHLEQRNFYFSKEDRDGIRAINSAIDVVRTHQQIANENYNKLENTKKRLIDPNDGMVWNGQSRGGILSPDSDDNRPLGEAINSTTKSYIESAKQFLTDIKPPRTEEADLFSRHTNVGLKYVHEARAIGTQSAIDWGQRINQGLTAALGWGGDRLDDLGTWTHQSLSSLLPGTDYSLSKSWDPAMHMELNEFHRTLDEMTPSADQATQATGGLWDSVDELDDGVGALGGTVDLATLGMDDMSASMGVGRQEAFALAGDLGTLEDQGRATADVLRLLAAMPRMPAGAGGAGGGWGPPTGGVAHGDPGLTRREVIEAERQRILNMRPPADLEDLFLSQREGGHNISLYASPEAWWEAHKQELANQLPSYASGTHFAPGGMALVGEMGPELVNLPRGSQVIPDPPLGRAVTVNVNVEGSVVAERDLAQRIRQELIRTSRRTVDLGFN